MPQVNKPQFQIGLVMAGAVSAGAYTAGVLDFLFEALHRWYKSHDNNPPHDIKIKVMTGASAGGMCSGISTLQFVDPTDYEKRQSSKLYNSWVNLVDIGPMLTTDDLKDGKVKSLLNSNIIDEIADKAFKITADYRHIPPFVSDDYHLLLTVTNTRGVTYSVDFSTQTEGNPYTVTNYGDFFHFKIPKPGMQSQPVADKYQFPYLLNPADTLNPAWSLFKEICKATGAFPLGLKARLLEQPHVEVYRHMFNVRQPVNIPEGKPYRFLGIDGGVVNNEPFEMAHDILAGGKGIRNVREATAADRAIIMVDPFPVKPVTAEYDEEASDLNDVALAFFNSLMGQALFKPEDLQPAIASEVRSRFLISPKRKVPRGGKGEFHLAGGAIGAFSGFIDRSFRQADYDLGRRNAQQFLRKYFLLADSNPLFSRWSEAQKNDLKIQYGDLPAGELPVIPLDTTLSATIEEPAWPQLTIGEFKDKIEDALFKRVKAIGQAYVKSWVLKAAWDIQLHRLPAKKVYEAFESSLRKAELIK